MNAAVGKLICKRVLLRDYFRDIAEVANKMQWTLNGKLWWIGWELWWSLLAGKNLTQKSELTWKHTLCSCPEFLGLGIWDILAFEDRRASRLGNSWCKFQIRTESIALPHLWIWALAAPPPTGPNSLILTFLFFPKSHHVRHWRPLKELRPFVREIPGPPLWLFNRIWIQRKKLLFC